MARTVDRVGGLSGVLFVVLLVASWFIGASSLEGVDQPGAAVAADLESRADGLGLGVLVGGLALVAGTWFVAWLSMRLAAAGPSVVTRFVLVAGVAMLVALGAALAVKLAEVTVDSLVAEPQAATSLWLLQQGFEDAVAFPLLAFVAGVSARSLAVADPPRWVGWSGLAIVAVILANLAMKTASLAVVGFAWVLVMAAALAFRGPARVAPG